MNKNETINRMIQMHLGVSGGKESQALVEQLRVKFDALGASASLSTASIAAGVRQVTADFLRSGVNRSLVDWAKYLEKVEKQSDKVSDSSARMVGKLNSVSGAISAMGSALLKPLNMMSSIANAGFELSLTGILKGIFNLNKEILGGAASWTKYGVGITQIESKLSSLRDKYHIIESEQIKLLRAYESGFNFPSLASFEKMLGNIKNAVGGNVEEMQKMQSIGQSIVEQFPDLEQSVTNLNEADKSRIKSLSQVLLATGKISFAQQKQWTDYANMNSQLSSDDKKRKDAIVDEIDGFNKLKEVLEKIAQDIHDKMLPFFEQAADWAVKFVDHFKSWASGIVLAGFALAGLATTLKTIAVTWELIAKMKALSGGKDGAGTIPGVGGTPTPTSISGLGALKVGAGSILPSFIGAEAGRQGYTAFGGKENSVGQDYATVGAAGAAGAAYGASAGPAGAVVGAGVGLVVGAVTATGHTLSYIGERTKETNDINAKILEQDRQMSSTIEYNLKQLIDKAEHSGNSDDKIYAHGREKVQQLIVKRDELEAQGYGDHDWFNNKVNDVQKQIRDIQNDPSYQAGSKRHDIASQENDEEKKRKDVALSLELAPKNDNFKNALKAYDSGASVNQIENIKPKTEVKNYLSQLKGDYGLGVQDKKTLDVDKDAMTFRQTAKTRDSLEKNIDEIKEKRKSGTASNSDIENLKKEEADLEIIKSQLKAHDNLKQDINKSEGFTNALTHQRQMAIAATLGLQQQDVANTDSILKNMQLTGDLTDKDTGLDKFNQSLQEMIKHQTDYLSLLRDQYSEAEMHQAKAISDGEKSIKLNEDQIAVLEKQPNKTKEDEELLENLKQQTTYQKNAVKERISELTATSQLKEMQTGINAQLQITIEAISKAGHVADGLVRRGAVEVSQAEALANLVDSMGAGFAASAEQRLNIAKAIDSQIKAEKENLDSLTKAAQSSVPEIAKMLQEAAHKDVLAGVKDAKELSTGDAESQANKKLFEIDTQRKEAQVKILDLQQKQAQTLKVLRDGYLSAINAMNAGAGTWGKLIIDQNKNTGFAVKNLKILQSMGAGGMGHGNDSRGSRGISQFTTDGFVGPKNMNRPDFYNGGGSIADEVRVRDSELMKVAGGKFENSSETFSSATKFFGQAVDRMRGPNGEINKSPGSPGNESRLPGAPQGGSLPTRETGGPTHTSGGAMSYLLHPHEYVFNKQQMTELGKTLGMSPAQVWFHANHPNYKTNNKVSSLNQLGEAQRKMTGSYLSLPSDVKKEDLKKMYGVSQIPENVKQSQPIPTAPIASTTATPTLTAPTAPTTPAASTGSIKIKGKADKDGWTPLEMGMWRDPTGKMFLTDPRNNPNSEEARKIKYGKEMDDMIAKTLGKKTESTTQSVTTTSYIGDAVSYTSPTFPTVKTANPTVAPKFADGTMTSITQKQNAKMTPDKDLNEYGLWLKHKNDTAKSRLDAQKQEAIATPDKDLDNYGLRLKHKNDTAPNNKANAAVNAGWEKSLEKSQSGNNAIDESWTRSQAKASARAEFLTQQADPSNIPNYDLLHPTDPNRPNQIDHWEWLKTHSPKNDSITQWEKSKEGNPATVQIQALKKYHSGGIVKGPLGSEQIIAAQGGERIEPISRAQDNSNRVIVIQGLSVKFENLDQLGGVIRKEIDQKMQDSNGYGLSNSSNLNSSYT